MGVGEFPQEEVVCEEPIEVISYKIGLCVVDPKGKECKTTFKRLAFKDGVSIVKCWPKTGRMHQIRVHLQFLGFPIANDPLYNSAIFGPEKGKGGSLGKSRETLVEDLIKHHTVENWINSDEYLASGSDLDKTLTGVAKISSGQPANASSCPTIKNRRKAFPHTHISRKNCAFSCSLFFCSNTVLALKLITVMRIRKPKHKTNDDI